MAFTLRRWFHPRQSPKRPEQPHRSGNWEIGDRVQLLQSPHAADDRPCQSCDVQNGKGDDFAPRGRVTDAPIQRVRSIFGEANDVGARLASGKATAKPCDCGSHQYDREPYRQPSIESPLDQIERQRPWCNEEHENPDRPVIEPVIQLVSVTDLPFSIALDVNRRGACHGVTYDTTCTRPASTMSSRCEHARANSASCVAMMIVRPSSAS